MQCYANAMARTYARKMKTGSTAASGTNWLAVFTYVVALAFEAVAYATAHQASSCSADPNFVGASGGYSLAGVFVSIAGFIVIRKHLHWTVQALGYLVIAICLGMAWYSGFVANYRLC